MKNNPNRSDKEQNAKKGFLKYWNGTEKNGTERNGYYLKRTFKIRSALLIIKNVF